jgi:hypothetical protein
VCEKAAKISTYMVYRLCEPDRHYITDIGRRGGGGVVTRNGAPHISASRLTLKGQKKGGGGRDRGGIYGAVGITSIAMHQSFHICIINKVVLPNKFYRIRRVRMNCGRWKR